MKNPKIIIREMRDDDLVPVSRLISASYEYVAKNEGYSQIETDSLIEARGSIHAISTQIQQYSFWVAMLDDKIVGALAIRQNVLEKLYVDPQYRQRGIGKTMFEWAKKMIADAGYNYMTFGAFPSSIGFYRKLGAKIVTKKEIKQGPLKDRQILIMHKSFKLPGEF